MTLDEYLTGRARGTAAPLSDVEVDAMARDAAPNTVRDAVLNAVTTQNSPAEWLAQRVAPDFKSTNQAGIYADQPDLAGLATAMAGPMKLGESPAFDRWFGKSKVADAEGRPLTVYRGATVDEGIRPNHWFSDSTHNAGSYAMQEGAAQPNVTPAHLRVENPLIVDARGKGWDEIDWTHPRHREAVDAGEPVYVAPEHREAYARGMSVPEEDVRTIWDTNALARAAEELGHDGLIVQNVGDWGGLGGSDGTTYWVRDPRQIKSAIGNRGTFDPSDPNITHALPPLVGATGLAEYLRRKDER